MPVTAGDAVVVANMFDLRLSKLVQAMFSKTGVVAMSYG